MVPKTRLLDWFIRAGNAEMAANRARWLKWANANRERLRATSLKWRERNREARNLKSREWTKANPKKKLAANVKWRRANPEKDREIARVYAIAKYHQNPHHRMTVLCRNRVLAAIKRGKGAKSAKTMDLIGCPTEHLRAHLESQFRPGMTWENLGPVWHIDHRKPCALFDLSDPGQQRACFHFSNLQPLFAEENLQKGDTYDEREAA